MKDPVVLNKLKSFWVNLKIVCRMIKIEHSIFALPFAYAGIFLGSHGWPKFVPFVLLTIAMVAIRSFAMAYNRLADINIDVDNPRTRGRALVTGELSVSFTTFFIIACGVIFILACMGLNEVCLQLSPFALIWSALYSYTKRFTKLCHFFLGSVLALAPIAGWISVDPRFHIAQFLMFFGVLFWVAGFDILYATQDRKFDRNYGLHSIPAQLGLDKSLTISTFCHVNTAVFFLLAGFAAGMGFIYFLVVGVSCIILIYEHSVISSKDMSKVNMAFFTLNGAISILFFFGVMLDVLT
ncbi:4-hydroxybenzoate octaprenyltransferase [Maridesulfovibrio bastinii]|uniref:4-hydroxybenzoate octaprenyltransferase n=1 Tax=Maridesulfovibrio bastinii TaxID=47157 RepID=UPI0004230DBB|nr:4-hydroxybenzoate octaprenyltransferase [Maridesulfovibrio bastinii]